MQYYYHLHYIFKTILLAAAQRLAGVGSHTDTNDQDGRRSPSAHLTLRISPSTILHHSLMEVCLQFLETHFVSSVFFLQPCQGLCASVKGTKSQFLISLRCVHLHFMQDFYMKLEP